MKRAIKYLKYWIALRLPFVRRSFLADFEQEKLAIAELRAIMTFFGHDLSDMTDEEIKEGVVYAGKEMAKIGLNADEATKAFTDMGKQLLDDDCVYCKDCGEEMEWQECWSCGGEGGRGWEDLQFEDPLWYSPDDFIECDECEGEGGMWICSNKNCG